MRKANKRSGVGARLLMSVLAFGLILGQSAFLAPKAHASENIPLAYVNEEEVVPLTGFPINFTSVAVRGGTLAVVGSDGKVYTRDGVVAGLTGVAKAYVYQSSNANQRIGFAIKTDGTVWSWGKGKMLGRIHDPGSTGENQNDATPGQVIGLPALQDIQIGKNYYSGELRMSPVLKHIFQAAIQIPSFY